MTEPYKATLLLELRDRLAAVERRIQKLETSSEQSSAVATPDHFRDAPEMVATDAELIKAWDARGMDHLGRIRFIYNLGREHSAANSSAVFTNSNHLAKPDSSSAPAVTRKPLVCPSAATIAECSGPCEQGFWYCDCGLLEKLNPDLSLQTQVPASGLIEMLVNEGYAITRACTAARVVANWLEQRNPAAIGWAEIIRNESEYHG